MCLETDIQQVHASVLIGGKMYSKSKTAGMYNLVVAVVIVDPFAPVIWETLANCVF